MNRTLRIVSIACLPLLASCSFIGNSTDLQSTYHDYRVVEVARSLVNPWAMTFLPGGDMLITERPGRLRILREGRLLPDSVEGVPSVLAQGQGGLLDVAAHPEFASNRLIYLSYSKPDSTGSRATTAVVRGRFENDRLTNVEDIFVAKSDGRGHYGSRLAFDRNGFLFITVGDRQIPPEGNLRAHPAQDLSNHHGKTIRLHDDGRVPADNPFVGQANALPEIWSYGHRNPQGLAIHPETGDLWLNEHGPQGGDELNLILKGSNYGWPVVGFGVNYGGAPIHEGTQRDGMQDPAHFWVPSIATSGLMIYTGDRFPRWRGSLFVGGMILPRIARLTVDGRRITDEETLLEDRDRVRDIKQGPDGYIYVAFDNDGGQSIVRLEPLPQQ
jgi:glucose/arabinose dehydrogenase